MRTDGCRPAVGHRARLGRDELRGDQPRGAVGAVLHARKTAALRNPPCAYSGSQQAQQSSVR